MSQDASPNFFSDFLVWNNTFFLVTSNWKYVILALRSIGLKCMDHLFFINIIAEAGVSLEAHLFDLLEGAFKIWNGWQFLL